MKVFVDTNIFLDIALKRESTRHSCTLSAHKFFILCKILHRKGDKMLQSQKQDKENKNIYLVSGIIMLFLVFMLISLVFVVSQVNQGSSAEMLRKRNASIQYQVGDNSFLLT